MMRGWFARGSYFMGLMTLLSWVGHNVAGGVAYTAADGLVVGDLGAVSPEYTVTVIEMLVRNGDHVKRGDLVARVSSSRIAQLIAALSDNSSSLVSKMAEISAKASMIEQLVSSAVERERITDANGLAIERSRNRNLIPLLTQNAVIEQVFKGKQELAVLMAEKDTMSRQVAQVTAASRFTDQALSDIDLLYDAGRMRAPMDGYISDVYGRPGLVVNPGDLVAELVGEQRYVLAYFPVSRLYEVTAGKAVTIDAGIGHWRKGTVTNVMPIAAKLPREFQRTLAPVERQQLVRIDFAKGEEVPPYFTKVVVR